MPHFPILTTHAFNEANGNYKISSPINYSTVSIEFTARIEDILVQRRVANCYLGYDEGGLLTSKKLKYSLATIKYD